MKKVAFCTLGCKVNQVETEQIKEDFINSGYMLVDFRETADIYIINTCTVTHVSDRKSRAMIRRAVRNNPQAVVAVIGCMAQVDAPQVAEIDGVNLIVGNKAKENIVEIIQSLDLPFEKMDKMDVKIMDDPIEAKDKLSPVLYSRVHERTRAFVKIQDGCRNFCSYCIVPYARGPVRSKLPDDVCKEIKQLAALGYQEIVLTGINTGLYGIDLNDWNLVRLLRHILDQVEGIFRIRLSSIEPLELKTEMIDLMAGESRLCRHLHIPLQSGSSRILKAMNRHYDREYYCDLLHNAAATIPGVALCTDVIVGFPGEEEKDFQDTLQLLQGLPLLDLHVFKYSPRPGTPAAEFLPRVSENVKDRRSDELISLAKNKYHEFIVNLLGQKVNVLVEKKMGNNHYMGLSENYMEVEFLSEKKLVGQIVPVIIQAAGKNVAIGKMMAE